MSVNILFCILRNKAEDNSKSISQVNIPMYHFQKKLQNSSGKKAFVYKSSGKVIILDFDDVSVKDIYYADTRSESGNYDDILITAFSVMNEHSRRFPSEKHELIILMEEKIMRTESVTFLNMVELIKKEILPMRFSVRFICNSPNDSIDTKLFGFISDKDNYVPGFFGSFEDFNYYLNEDGL